MCLLRRDQQQAQYKKANNIETPQVIIRKI